MTSKSPISTLRFASQKEYGETPEKLRELERGWRERRRALGEITMNAASSTLHTGYADKAQMVKAGPSRTMAQRPDVGRPTYSPDPNRVRFRAVRPTTNPAIHPIAKTKPFGQTRPTHSLQRRETTLPTPPTSPKLPSTDNPLDESAPPAPLPAPGPNRRGSRDSPSSKRTPAPRVTLQQTPPQRILRGLLPPTTSPMPLTSGSSTTIHIPTSSRDIQIATPDCFISINEDGTEVRFTSTERGSRRLRLADAHTWSRDERKEWATVRDLVEGFKRATPRVRQWACRLMACMRLVADHR